MVDNDVTLDVDVVVSDRLLDFIDCDSIDGTNERTNFWVLWIARFLRFYEFKGERERRRGMEIRVVLFENDERKKRTNQTKPNRR
mmetsp:Transcript_18578/g.44858  ORF Transcript_18578/g.44858 Transcript_18578/m.44858 type:complete len:85 (+) Transcript_18578:689-943(+)